MGHSLLSHNMLVFFPISEEPHYTAVEFTAYVRGSMLYRQRRIERFINLYILMAVGVRDEAKQNILAVQHMSEEYKPFRQPSHSIKALYTWT